MHACLPVYIHAHIHKHAHTHIYTYMEFHHDNRNNGIPLL